MLQNVQGLLIVAIDRTYAVTQTRGLLSFDIVKVHKPPRGDHGTCYVRVTDSGFNEAATSAMYNVRSYPRTARRSESVALRQAALPSRIKISALIVAQAYPYLIED